MSRIKTPLRRVLAANTKTTQTAGTALLCSILAAKYLAPRATFQQGTWGGKQESEVLSEAICWSLMPFLVRIGFLGAQMPTSTSKQQLPRYQQHHRQQHSSSLQQHGESSIWAPGLGLWVIALGISVACWFRAEVVGSLGLFPLITPLLLLVERRLQSSSSGSSSKEWGGGSSTSSGGIRPSPGGAPYYPANTSAALGLASALATSLFSILTMLDGNIVGTILSAIPTLALLIVYVAFVTSTSPPTHNQSALKYMPSFGADLDGVIRSGRISVRILVLLGIVLFAQIWSFGFPAGINLTGVVLSGLARAGSWYFTLCTIRGTNNGNGDEDLGRDGDRDHSTSQQPRYGTSWTVATLMGTFCLLSSRDPSIQSSDFQALLQVIASLVVLGQIIQTLPRQARAKSVLWVFGSVSVVPFLYHGFALRQLNSSSPSWTPSRPHPADTLVQRATADFNKLLERQSKTYDDAVSEYKQRYGISPPPGFDKWYELAVANDSPIIDEFDAIFEKISPFLKLSGQEITKIINKARKMPNVELWDCSFTSTDDKAMTQCMHPSRSLDRHISTMFDQMLEDLKGLKIPEVRFLVNHFDEPRVVFPPQPSDPRVALETEDLSHQPTWDKLTRLCHDSDSTNKTHQSPTWPKYTDVTTYSLPIVTDRHAEMDLCQHPEYRPLNGLFVSPTSFKLISGLVPILSTGAPSTMGDILIPSPAYSESQFQYHPASDLPWAKKHNKLYWAGSTTGGFASDDRLSWPSFQRQRFVSKVQNIDDAPNNDANHKHMYLHQISPEMITTSKTSLLNSHHYDVSFTHIFQCTPRQCRAQKSYFRTKSWANSNAPLASKITFDIDGNGISGRYYKLLASNSLPFKQTILREWHDDRLWPWVHYIPVSQTMEELPELVRWFLGSKQGGMRAEEVAGRGKDWFGKGMRGVDRSLYLYRLLLELARVQDVNREAWDPS